MQLAVATTSEVKENGGMIFTPRGKLRVAGDSYIVPIRLISSAIYAKGQLVVSKVRNITHLFSAVKDVNGKRVLMDLSNNYKEEFEETVEQLREIIHHHLSRSDHEEAKVRRKRPKRGAAAVLAAGGLIAAIGGLIGYNSVKVDNVHQVVEALKTDVITIDTQVNLHSQILNNTATQTLNNAQAVKELEQALNKTLTLLRTYGDSLAELRAVQRAHAIFLHIQLALTSFKEECRMLDVALDELMDNYLHPFIVSDAQFLNVLKDIEKNAFHPLFPPETANLRLFREVTRVEYRHSRMNGTIMIYLIIPLLSSPLYSFTTYSITSFPVAVDPLNKTDVFATAIVDHPFISISDDQRHYMLHRDLEGCKSHADLFVCPPTSAIYARDVDSCEGNMFFNRTFVPGLCNYQLKRQHQPTFQLVHDQWLYTISKNMTMLIQCPHKGPQKLPLTNSSGFLELPDSCSASAEELFLPSSSVSMASEPMVMGAPFSRTSAYLQSKELLRDVELYDEISEVVFNYTGVLEINTKILPLVKRMSIIHSKAQNISVSPDWFMYIISCTIALIISYLIWSWCRNSQCSCPRRKYYNQAEVIPIEEPVLLTTHGPRRADTPRPQMGLMQRLAVESQRGAEP